MSVRLHIRHQIYAKSLIRLHPAVSIIGAQIGLVGRRRMMMMMRRGRRRRTRRRGGGG